jgi:hypothetical protein
MDAMSQQAAITAVGKREANSISLAPSSGTSWINNLLKKTILYFIGIY